jgi:hypothetical protein
MVTSLLNYFKTGPGKPLFADPAAIRHIYERKRWRILLSLIAGYGFFYTCRLGLAVTCYCKPCQHGHESPANFCPRLRTIYSVLPPTLDLSSDDSPECLYNREATLPFEIGSSRDFIGMPMPMV